MSKFTDNDVVVEKYDSAAIAAWEEEVKTLSTEIKSLAPLLEDAQKKFKNSDAELSKMESKITDLNGDIARIMKGSILETFAFGNLVQLKNFIFGDPEINAMRTQKNYYAPRLRTLENETFEQKNLVEKYKENLKASKERKDLLETLIDDAKKFLDQLKKKPKDLLLTLKNRISADLEYFDKKHPKQDIHVRLCLYNLRKKLNKITEDATDNTTNQVKYLQLCGFLWNLYHQFEYNNPKPNLKFSNLLHSLLIKTHIPEDADLPDDLKTGLNCVDQFKILKMRNTDIFPMSVSDAKKATEKAEKKDYAEILDLIRKNVKTDSKDLLHRQVRELAEEVDKEIQKSRCLRHPKNEADEEMEKNRTAHHPKPDYKLYTRVLNSAHGLLGKDSEKNFNDFCCVEKFVSGQPSFPKQVLGAMSGIVTTVLTAGCILLTAATFGAASPVTLPLIVGSKLAQVGATIATGLSMGLMGTSWGFFSKNSAHGISAKMRQIEQTKEKEKDQSDADLLLEPAFGCSP